MYTKIKRSIHVRINTIKVMNNLLETLKRYETGGWVYLQVHPTLPLTIWNYSQTTQYERKWDEITLMCRGLVTDDKGNVIARPFKKFFNIEEGEHTPTPKFDVYEKMDGSLGILFSYKGEWIFASRGSFTSEHSREFKEIFSEMYNSEDLSRGYTYMFEIIFPENRIVCDYEGLRDVVLLGCVETTDGYEVDVHTPYYESRFNVVKKYDGIRDFTKLKDQIGKNREGYVIRFSNGDRCKIKGEEYIRLHRIMTQVSTTSIWDVLANGGSMENLLKDVPDEFYNKISEYENELIEHYNFLDSSIRAEFKIINKRLGEVDQKTFALYITKNPFKSFLFSLRAGRDISEMIWDWVKPDWELL